MLLYNSQGTKMKIRVHYLLSLALPLTMLSGCSYRGSVKPLQDGDFLLRDSYVVRVDTFETVQQHMKAGDSFCLYLSQSGCGSCEEFEKGFKVVNAENKILTLHLSYTTHHDDIKKLFNLYPELYTETAPSFAIAENGTFTDVPFHQINNASRLRNALKSRVSLSNHYYFENACDYKAALGKANVNEATVIEYNPNSDEQISVYQSTLNSKDGAVFIHPNPSLENIQIYQITK